MSGKWLAHITDFNGKRTEQTVKEHSLKTAEYAGEALKTAGLYSTAYLAGLIHDIGKCNPKYLKYIEDAYCGKDVIRGSVNHTFASVIYLLEKYHLGKPQGFNTLTCEIIAFATGSHHGEFDCVDIDSKNGFQHRISKDKAEIYYEESVKNFFEDFDESEVDRLFKQSAEEIRTIFNKMLTDFDKIEKKVSYLAGMLARMLLSAVIEGDRRDTSEFMNGKVKDRKAASGQMWEEQIDYFEEKKKELSDEKAINRSRAYISEKCKEFSKRKSGIYKITVPTGAGKTLSTLRYALYHAKEFDKKRIIFIIPLLSILEQNSKVIHKYIKDKDIIREHHSNVVLSKDTAEQLDEFELLSDMWDSPVIISTLVQLLLILFSGKTSAIRRMHCLSDSVIVIDEVQTLPRKITDMFNMAINFLVSYFNVTVILSSATQPCLEQANMPLLLSKENPEMVPYNKEIFSVFKRTVIIDKTTPYGMTTEELADFSRALIEKHSSLLIVCNTKTTALNLYKNLKQRNKNESYKLFHLSTLMCMQHRINTLNDINACLDYNNKHEEKRKIICVSTQLVEAGVDFSFESVIRIKAGIDNIAQAAGRCNRNSDFGGICDVYIVNLKNENLSMLKEIKDSQNCTTELLNVFSKYPEKFENDLLSENSIKEYYKFLFNMPDIKNQFKYPYKNKYKDVDFLFDLLSDNKKYTQRSEHSERYFLKQAFKTAGENFTVFDDNTVDIIVPYEEGENIIADLCSKKAKFDFIYLKERIDAAKKYTVQIFENQKKKLEDYGVLFSDKGNHFLAVTINCYNKETGLDV